jgi:hypothetical protein
MRLALAGFGGPLAPLIIPFNTGGFFTKADYVALGYKNFDVMCVGGAGGFGGGVIPPEPYAAGSWLMKGGGAGGGGGLMRAKGLLLGLPPSCAVVVGAAGARGRDSDVIGASSFNGTTCRASGGKGGKGVTSLSATAPSGGDGGAGGKGGTTTAGGGAAGGIAGNPNNGSVSVDNTGGSNGTWDGIIGTGGGGGPGGVAKRNGGAFIGFDIWLPGWGGGFGSYAIADTTVYGFGGYPDALVTGGGGGGAKTTPLDHLLRNHGSYSNYNANVSPAGFVVIVLTA